MAKEGHLQLQCLFACKLLFEYMHFNFIVYHYITNTFGHTSTQP